ncbi:MAG: Plug domain-containing protein, partial [Fibrobacter sp.]|nr:Plug domain-containing protein [Fibrobacter sp.]
MVQDTSFAPGEKLNVEILETGEAIQTVVGENFSTRLPEDTLWNVCVTNSDTSGAEKEKCYELVYHGQDSVFSMALGDSAVASSLPGDSGEMATAKDSGNIAKDSGVLASDSSAAQSDVNVDDLLAPSNSRVTEMKKVVVQLRRRPKRKAGESVVSAKSIKRMPGLAEADVIRSIQALPGVVASSDFSTKIYVRGGAADQNLFLYDNSVVYSPTHFFGLFSTFLVETIDEVQFYKSGFPAQYGNRLSSVLKMDGRAGG